LLSTNALVVFTQPSSLTVGGELEVQAGARLRLDGSTPARDLTLMPGALWTGPGRLKLEGNCQLVLVEDTTVPGDLQMDAATAVSGTGRLRLAGALSLIGNFNVPLSLAASAVVDFGATTFNSNVTVMAGGTMTVNSSATITLNTVLTNLGTLRWVSRYNTVNLQGSGRVENLGLWEFYRDPVNDFGSESVVGVPVTVPAGGRLLLSTNALVVFTQPSSLTVGGELEVQAGARLRLDGSTPARDLMLLPGSTETGPGTVLVEGANRVLLEGNVNWGIGLLDMTSASHIAGNLPLSIAPGAALRFDHTSTITNSISVDGTLSTASSGVTLTVNGTLTLNASGTLNNPGTIKAGTFTNNGGTINGNPPAPVTSSPAGLRIMNLSVGEPPTGNVERMHPFVAPDRITITWTGLPGRQFNLQTSDDLVHWDNIPVLIEQVGGNLYRASLSFPSKTHQFFRIRELP
jgi:hypothetical protein